MAMRKPTVGRGKGRVETRLRGNVVSDTRFEDLVGEYVTGPQEARLQLALQWTKLRAAGVQLAVIGEEYKVGTGTISTAIEDPTAWAQLINSTPGAHRLGKRRTAGLTVQALKARRSKATAGHRRRKAE